MTNIGAGPGNQLSSLVQSAYSISANTQCFKVQIPRLLWETKSSHSLIRYLHPHTNLTLNPCLYMLIFKIYFILVYFSTRRTANTMWISTYQCKQIGKTIFFIVFWKSRSECIQILVDVITSGGRKSNRAKLFVLECQLKCFPYRGLWCPPCPQFLYEQHSLWRSLWRSLWHNVFIVQMTLGSLSFYSCTQMKRLLDFSADSEQKTQRKQKDSGTNACIWWRYPQSLWLWPSGH